MQQRSPEWFSARKGRVTGSNVGAILGLNPYRTSDDVLRAMVREYHGAESEFTGNAATEWGQFNEAGAQAEYGMETGRTVIECGFYVHPEHEWLGASPDGLVGDDGLIEIKCPFGQRDKNPPQFKTAEQQQHYLAQVQIELACTGREWCDFYQWAPAGSLLERIDIDRDWLADAIPMLEAFHKRYLAELDNDEHLKPLRKQINTIAADKLLAEYDQLSTAIELATARKKDVLAELVQLAGERDAEIFGRKLTQVEKAGSVQYAKAIKELAPNADLSKWTGKPSSYWRLS